MLDSDVELVQDGAHSAIVASIRPVRSFLAASGSVWFLEDTNFSPILDPPTHTIPVLPLPAVLQSDVPSKVAVFEVLDTFGPHALDNSIEQSVEFEPCIVDSVQPMSSLLSNTRRRSLPVKIVRHNTPIVISGKKMSWSPNFYISPSTTIVIISDSLFALARNYPPGWDLYIFPDT